MAFDGTKWTVENSTGAIRYTGADHGVGGETYETVIDFHRWLQDLADDASYTGDDHLDITSEDPSARSTDNIIRLKGIYNITATEAEHLYDGSIIQGTGGTEEIWDGIVNYGNADVQIILVQDGAILTDDWWNQSGIGLNPDATAGISHRFMIKVRDTGADIDNRRLLGLARTFGNTYSEFNIAATARGNNTLALTDANDLNNNTASGVVATWTTITNLKEGFSPIDVNNDTTDEYYYGRWDRAKGTYSINQFVERQKYDIRSGTAATLYGIDGGLFRGITHQVAISGGAGTWVEPESLSWGTGATAGTGQLLAVDNTTASSSTKLWMQLLTGVIPNANTITGNGGATATAGTVTPRTVVPTVVGVSTGSALIGSYGFGLQATDLTSADSVIELITATTITPPNYIDFTLNGPVVAEDQILIGPWDGSTVDDEGFPAFQYDQLSLLTTLNAGSQTSVVCDSAIPTDTPGTGTIRVQLDTGQYRYIEYTGYSGATFTTASTDWADPLDATSGNNIFVSYLDKGAATDPETFTMVYLAPRQFVVLVRDGKGTPIKQFISSATAGSTGGSATVIRTPDV